jgi:MFS family permease
VQDPSIQRRLVLYTALAHGLVHTIELTFAALLLRIGDEFGQGAFMLGVIANVSAFTFGAGALPSGVLVDRLGSQRVITFGFLVAGVASILVGFSPNALVLGALLGLLGLGIGFYHPAALSLIALTAEKRGLVLGYHGVAGNIGVALAPVLAVGLAEAIDWRAAYFFLGGLSLLLVLLLRAAHLPEVGRVAPAQQAASTGQGAWAGKALLPLLLVYLVFVLNGFIYRGSLTFLPAHVEENLHISILGIDEAAFASTLTTVALLAGAGGQYFGGSMCQRYALERLAPPLALALVPALLLMGASSGLLLVAGAAVFVFFNFAGQPVYTSLIAEYTPQGAVGRSYGISFFAAFGLGSVAASFAGFFAERWGTGSVFLSLSAFSLLVVGLTLVIWRLSRHQSPAARQPAAAPTDLSPDGPPPSDLQ